jgi:hypothetical protein
MAGREYMGRNHPKYWRDSALGRGESAHTSYQCYNKGLGVAFDGPGNPAYLLRGHFALWVNFTIFAACLSRCLKIEWPTYRTWFLS